MFTELEIKNLLFSDKSSSIDNSQLFEIYKIFVEMTDRISARRQIANSFFLSINMAALAVLGHFQDLHSAKHFWFLNVGGILISWMWIAYIKSLKKLNRAKFNIIHAIEDQLSTRAYTAEWQILLKDKHYWRLSDIEAYVPLVFILINVIVLIMDCIPPLSM